MKFPHIGEISLVPMTRGTTEWGFYVREILILAVFLGFWALVVYTLISVARWANRSRRVPEAYYRGALAGQPGQPDAAGGTATLELLREKERIAHRRQREGQKLGGMVTAAVGIALAVFLRSLPSPGARQSFLVGLIPLLIGVAILAYAFLLAPKD